VIYAAIGRRLRGKTTWIYFHASKLPQRVVFDPRRQIRNHSEKSRVVSTSAEVEAAMDDLFVNKKLEEVVIVPADDPQPVFETLCEEVRHWIELDDRRALAVVIDEARFVKTEVPACQWILRCSPHDTIHVFFSAHRPSDLSTDARAIIDRMILFHTTQEHDLKVIGDRCGSEVVDKVRTLDQFAFVEWDDGLGRSFVHDDPSKWYVSLRDDQQREGLTVVRGGRSFGNGKLFGS